MTKEQVGELIRSNKAPFVRIMDASGKMLYSIECADESKSVADAAELDYTVDTLLNALPYFSGYGSVKIMAATPPQKRSAYRGCFHYTCKLADNVTTGNNQNNPANNQFDPMKQMLQMMQMMQMMQTMNGGNNGLAVEVEKLRLQMAHEKELMKYRNDDPMKWASLFGPTAMRMAGMKSDEIKETIQMTAMSYGMANGANPMQQNPSSISGTGQQQQQGNLNTSMRTFEQLVAISDEQKNKEIENLVNMIASQKKISAEHFIMLLEILIAKPDLAPRAIQLHQSGMI